jgi:hypothetical protein
MDLLTFIDVTFETLGSDAMSLRIERQTRYSLLSIRFKFY